MPDAPPDHTDLLNAKVLDIIARAHWQTATSVQHVAGGQHQYCVIGWAKDDVTEAEFWSVRDAIREHGRRESWRSPPGFYSDGRQIEMANVYLYVKDAAGDLYALWYTKPKTGPPMLNREDCRVQLVTPTRRPLAPGEQIKNDTDSSKEATPYGRQLRLT